VSRRNSSIFRHRRRRAGLAAVGSIKALLLSVWYDLSDVKLAEALDDRASFCRFCGFSGNEATPERTAFVRFRKALTVRALDKLLFDEITANSKPER